MSTRSNASTIVLTAVLAGTLVVGACSSSNNAEPAETAASPVTAGRGISVIPNTGDGVFGNGVTYDRSADAQIRVGKLLAPVPAVWDAVVAAMSERMKTPTLMDRSVGRVGDTTLVLLRQWNGQQVSRYFSCGTTMDGARADAERIHAVFLAQMTRLKSDTVAVSVHLSGYSTSLSGNGGAQCETTGRMENEVLDEVYRRLGVRR
jgi:hypothetical protein